MSDWTEHHNYNAWFELLCCVDARPDYEKMPAFQSESFSEKWGWNIRLPWEQKVREFSESFEGFTYGAHCMQQHLKGLIELNPNVMHGPRFSDFPPIIQSTLCAVAKNPGQKKLIMAWIFVHFNDDVALAGNLVGFFWNLTWQHWGQLNKWAEMMTGQLTSFEFLDGVLHKDWLLPDFIKGDFGKHYASKFYPELGNDNPAPPQLTLEATEEVDPNTYWEEVTLHQDGSGRTTERGHLTKDGRKVTTYHQDTRPRNGTKQSDF